MPNVKVQVKITVEGQKPVKDKIVANVNSTEQAKVTAENAHFLLGSAINKVRLANGIA